MKKLILLLITLGLFTVSQSQIIKRLGDRAKQKMEQKAGQKVDKGIDDAVDGKRKKRRTRRMIPMLRDRKKHLQPMKAHPGKARMRRG